MSRLQSNTELNNAPSSPSWTPVAIKKRVKQRVEERNSWSTYAEPTPGKVLKLLCGNASKMVFQRGLTSQQELDEVFPVKDVDWPTLKNPNLDRIQSTWIGHATVFVQMGGYNILTDPVFSQRCSAVQWAGPKRLRRPACTIEELCLKEKVGVDIVMISHNHYDHLDYNSVQELAAASITMDRPMMFVVALGLKKWFERYIPNSVKGRNSVIELDWHEKHIVESTDGRKALEVTGIPMQHWSNRNGFDKDKSLWCGFGVKTVDDDNNSSRNFLFSGDTGYFEGLDDIGEKYGEFDLAAIPIGAYEPRWFMVNQHTNPDDAVKMMTAVKAKHAWGIHWGTFALTIEPTMEPRERLTEAMKLARKDPSTFVAGNIGETKIV